MPANTAGTWLIANLTRRAAILTASLLTLLASPLHAQSITVTVDGQPLVTSTPAQEIGGSILVGMRDLFEALGATVAWEPAQKMATLTRGARVVTCQIGRTSAKVDGVDTPMGVAPRIIKGSTYLPARVPCEGLGATVAWDAKTRTVKVTTPNSPGQTAGETRTLRLPGDATLDLVWVPGGSFTMGLAEAPAGWEGDPRPPHPVALDGFWMGRTEVTVAQWRSVMGDVSADNRWGDDHPMVSLTWDRAQEFCQKAGLQLPTEAQWEFAARGTAGSAYPWGNDWDKSRCQNREEHHGFEATAPAGHFAAGASWCGAFDLAGSVWEWCADGYDASFYATPAATVRNPVNPDASSGQRVLRGGSWGNDAYACRAALRYRQPASSGDHFVGFRAVMGTG